MSSTIPSSTLRDHLSGGVAQLLSRLLAVILLCLALGVLSDAFLTRGNVLNVLRQTSLLFFMASGLTLVIITGGLDLSVGTTIAFAACLAGTAIKTSGEPLIGVAVGLGAGMAVGLCNGLMVAFLRIPSFIATYGMLWILQGVAYGYMGGQAVYGFPRGFRLLGNGLLFGIPVPILIMGVFLVLGELFAARTIWGQQIYAIGANSVAARLSGVPVKRRLMLAYLISGAMAGFASLVFLARLNSAEADIGADLTLPAIAAVLIGGASLFGGVGTIGGTFIGALLLTIVLNGMNLLGIEAPWQPLVMGVIIIAAVWLDLRAGAAAKVT